MVFIGYEKGSKAYRAYNPATGRVVITRDCVFDEGDQWDWSDLEEAEIAGDNIGGSTFTVEYPVVETGELEQRRARRAFQVFNLNLKQKGAPILKQRSRSLQWQLNLSLFQSHRRCSSSLHQAVSMKTT
jgi:hypothetical protein